MVKRIVRRSTLKHEYQVLPRKAPDGTKRPIENFTNKAKAMARIQELSAQGIKADFWDTLDNPLSEYFQI